MSLGPINLTWKIEDLQNEAQMKFIRTEQYYCLDMFCARDLQLWRLVDDLGEVSIRPNLYGSKCINMNEHFLFHIYIWYRMTLFGWVLPVIILFLIMVGLGWVKFVTISIFKGNQ